MRLNDNTIICGEKVILVPYRACPASLILQQTYHEWMKSPELLELTASEPLSLEEEYEMQQKWHTDEDSTHVLLLRRDRGMMELTTRQELTFILLARPVDLPSNTTPLLTTDQVKQCRMIGDVNMFLPNGIAEDGECEIMIAAAEDRRKGYAVEALQLFLAYATTELKLPPNHLIARIGRSNSPSIRLFEKLGFGVVKVVEVWDEVEMRWGHKPNPERNDSDSTMGKLGFEIPPGRIGVYE